MSFFKRAWHVITGGLTIAAGIALSPAVLNQVSPKVAGIVMLAGTILQSLGIVHADGQPSSSSSASGTATK
jgi:hypothetical protein